MIRQLIEFIKNIFRVAFQGQFLIYFVFWVAVLFAFNKSGIYYAIAFTFFSIPFVLRKNYWDRTALWILLYSITLALFGLPQKSIPGGGTDQLFILLSPVPFYLFGKYVLFKTRSFNDVIIFLAITILCYGFLLYKTTIIDVIEVGIVNPFFSFEDSMGRPATHYGTIASLGLVGIIIFLTDSIRNRTFMDWVLLLCTLLSLLCLVHLVRRSGLIIFFSVVALSFFYILRGRTSSMTSLWIVIFVLLFVLVFYITFSNIDVMQAIDLYSERNEEDLQGLGGRGVRWKESIGAMLSHPFGWNGNRSYYAQVHNYWLDNARLAGILPFMFSVLAVVHPIKRCISLFKVHGNCYVVLLIGILAALCLSNFVEPQLDSVPFHVSLMYMLCGMVNSKCLDRYLFN